MDSALIRTMNTNAVRLKLRALAYKLSNFLRTPALSEGTENWSLTAIRDKVVQSAAKVLATSAMPSCRERRWPCRATCSAASAP